MKKIIKSIIGLFVVLASLYLFLYLKYKDTTFVLVYHRIDNYKGGLKSLYVKPSTFEKQMNYLFRRGYRTISLTELKAAVQKNDKKFLRKKFCITFDDGYEDLLNAYPVLKKYGFVATVFIHTQAVKDGYYTYPSMTEAKMISFDRLKKILDVFEIGSHTVSHPDLSKVSEEKIVYELKESKKIIEDTLGVKIYHFCYPFGKIFENYKKILQQEGYETAVTLKNGLIELDKEIDFYCLPRVEWKEVSSMSVKDFLKNIDFYLKTLFAL
jgi:peptidoglycan/xylan/chitin deacetylase (PgdA/CDA1 family)